MCLAEKSSNDGITVLSSGSVTGLSKLDGYGGESGCIGNSWAGGSSLILNF